MHRPAAILDADLECFFEEAAQGFDHATGQRGESKHDYLVAGRHVRVRFAGSSLEHLARPLAHLKCGSAAQSVESAEFEILAWDSADGWLPPPPPWDFQRLAHCGAIAGLENDRVCVNYSADHGLLCLYHRPTRRALYWLPEAQRLPYWETAAPFRILLHWWSQSFGGQVSHAAAVGWEGKGLLLAGRGGSGKSTTAIACVDSGMQYVGDDYVLLTREPVPIAHSLYHSAKIHTPFLRQALPHWQGRVAAELGPERKSLLFLQECLPQQVCNQLAICGVIQPKVAAAPYSRISPQPPSLGLLAIAPSTMYQLPEARQTTLSFLADWMLNVPTARLHLGSDLGSAPRELRKILSKQEVQHAA
jgi:hypothetical protein